MKNAMIFFSVWLIAEPTAAQNLLLNGEFNADTNGWVGFPSSTLSWVSDDGGIQHVLCAAVQWFTDGEILA